MPRHILRSAAAVAGVVVSCLFSGKAHAQVPADGPPDESVELDFRAGGFWRLDAQETRPSLGGRLGLYLWSGEQTRRLSLQVTGDYRGLGHEVTAEEGTGIPLQTTRSVFVLGSSVGFDVWRTPHMTVDVRAGALVLRSRQTLEISSEHGFTNDAELWEPVCHFQGYSYGCQTDYDGTATVAVGARYHFATRNNAFVGVDYTYLLRGHHLLVASVGVRIE